MSDNTPTEDGRCQLCADGPTDLYENFNNHISQHGVTHALQTACEFCVEDISAMLLDVWTPLELLVALQR